MKLPFSIFAPTKRIVKKSSPSQVERALNAVRGEQGTSIWSGHLKAERFHMRLKQIRTHDRRKR